MKSYWKKRLTAIALVCLMVLMMVPETALSVYAADEDEILVGAEEIVEQDAEVPEEAVELPEISEVYPETLEGSEEEFVEEDAEEVIIEDAPVILEEEAEPEIQSEVPEIYDAEIEVADPAAVDAETAEAEELVGAAASTTIKVTKVWNDSEDHGNDKVTAVVKRGNTTVGTVTLESSNGWRAEVTGLDANTTYTVEETAINGEPITGKYEATVQSSSRTEYVWAKKGYGDLESGEIYAFTYKSNNKTYVFGANSSDDLIGSTDGLNSDGSPNSSISDNFMWDVSGSGSWSLHNKGRNKYLYIDHLIAGGDAGLQSSSSSVLLDSSGEIYIDGWFGVDNRLYANGSSIRTTRGSGSKFTPYLLTDIITVTEFTITNTKINNYQLVYDANGGTDAPAAQQSEPTTATSQAFTVSTTAPSRGEAYSFEGWATTPNATTANVGSSVTVTTSDPQVDGVYTKTIYAVWKARDEFYVYHTGVAGGNLETRYIGGSSNDLTLNLTTDTLYGGYYLESGLTKPADGAAYDGSNWTFTNAQTEFGTAITPVAGKTYYVKEVPKKYLKPTTYVLYDTTDKEGASNCKGRLKYLFALAAVDDELTNEELQYKSVGFDVAINGEPAEPAYSSQEYTAFVINRNDKLYRSYTVTDVFKTVQRGYLTVANMSSNLGANQSYTITPYWVTKDNIKVTSAYHYQLNTGNGYHYGWDEEAGGVTKAMAYDSSTLTPQSRTSNTRKLTVSRYVFNEDEPKPTESVNPPETVEPTTEPTTIPTETVEPEPTAEPIVEPTTVPTETVEPEPTTEPTVEPTTAPEEETVEPSPTTAPMAPSSSSMNNTTPSGVIAKLLRMLGSLFK